MAVLPHLECISYFNYSPLPSPCWYQYFSWLLPHFFLIYCHCAYLARGLLCSPSHLTQFNKPHLTREIQDIINSSSKQATHRTRVGHSPVLSHQILQYRFMCVCCCPTSMDFFSLFLLLLMYVKYSELILYRL